MRIAILSAILCSVLAAIPCCRKGEESYASIGAEAGLSSFSGARVVVEGRLAPIPWQHLIRRPDEFPEISYLDFGAGKQTVLYSKSPIVCPGTLKVWGKVVEVRGESKRPGSDSPAVEYQILLDRWECLPESGREAKKTP